MFASAAIRKEVPVEEQLGLMPFKISETQRFQKYPHTGGWRRHYPSRRR